MLVSIRNLALPSAYSMIVYEKRDRYFVKDGNRGNILYSDTDAAEVIQRAIDNTPNPGGTILIKRGDYILSRAIRITKHINLIGEGVGATRLYLAPDANSRMIEYCINPDVVNTYGAIQPHMYIAHMLLHGRNTQQTSGSEAITTHAEGDCDRVADWLLFNVWISNYKGHGVRIRTTHNWLILHSSIEHNDGNAVHVEQGDDGIVGFSLIYNNLNGIYINNTVTPIRIIGNRIAVFRESGISINSSRFAIIEGNYILAAGVRPNRYIYINNSRYNTIIGNIFDSDAASIPDYGIYEDGTSDINVIENNIIAFINIEPVRLVGVNSKARYNYASIGIGISRPSINSGVATINVGSTRVTVQHRLYKAPTKVFVTPLVQPPGRIWVENITATSFDIVTDTAPTINLRVAWYAEI